MERCIKPDFSKAYSKANEILVSSHIVSTFPFSAFELLKEQTSIPCRTFKKARSYGLNIEHLGSESAIIIELGGKRIIFYDESKPMAHIKYSILHELGHDSNGHDLGIKDEEIYHRYEIEANYFVAQLLMPEQILRELIKRGVIITKQFLIKHFGVSGQAAQKRLDTLAKTNVEWRSRSEKEYDDAILFKFASFIDGIFPRRAAFDFEVEYERQRERDSWF